MSNLLRGRFCDLCNDYHLEIGRGHDATLDLPKLTDTLAEVIEYLVPLAEDECQGDPPRMVPNAAAKLLHAVRVAKHSAELVGAMGEPEPCDSDHPCSACAGDAVDAADSARES